MSSLQHDDLDRQVNSTVQGSALGLFLTELFQGSGQLALFLLLLEAVSEWADIFAKPDVYVLLIAAVGQSAWLARLRQHGQALPWWSRLIGLMFYALAESLIEGPSFFLAPHHITFGALMLLYAWGAAMENRNAQPATTMTGIVLSRTAQGLGPILFYIALDLRGGPWFEGLSGFFHSAPHAFLMALAVTQVGALISLALIARRQQKVIADLLHQLKTLSRWGFGSRVVGDVLRANAPQSASRVERSIGFIDIRGFTAWSETRQPEDVVDMLNRFYAAVLNACGDDLIKSKMSGDEVLLVLPADDHALRIMQKALQATMVAVQPLQLSAGAGLWTGPVVEGFFGAQASQIHDVIGDTVNTAKRLCDQAKRGQLLAGPVDYLADQETERIRLSVKGKQQPLICALYQLDPSPPPSPPGKS